MHRNRLSLALFAALVASSASACGPDFPNEVLDDRARTLSHLPEGAFHVEVARLLPKPDARFVANESQDYWEPETAQRELRSEAEGRDLDPGEHERVVAMRQSADAAAAYAAGDGLPDDLRHYVAGAVAWEHDQLDLARDHFERALAANTAADARRASWAQYMLARIAARGDDLDAAAVAFAKVRERVAAGAPDPVGLAVASYGEEAALHLDAYSTAPLNLYLQQAATGSVSGANSVLMLTRSAFSDAEMLKAWIADPLARRVAVAYAFARSGELVTDRPGLEGAEYDYLRDPYRIGESSAIVGLLEAIEASPQADTDGVDRLAAVAYRAGRFDLAERLVTQDASPLSAWVRAKLALRKGDRDGAAKAYAEAATGFPLEETWGGQFGVSSEWEVLQPQCQVNAELGTLNLARGDYVAAMEALYAAGGHYWMDAQYVADRVLTLDELRAFVAKHAASATAPTEVADDVEGAGYGDVAPLLRDLFARRLMRAGQYDEALPYFRDDDTRGAAQRYAAALRRAQGGGFWFDRVGRAEAWFEAATIARASGMEILGTEGQPDFEIWGGNYGRDPGHYDAEWNWIPEPPTDLKLEGEWIGADEPQRLAASKPPYLSRFQYRQVAADHVMQAASFVPTRSQAFAAMLCTGTGWLIDREPEAAHVLYRRYVADGALVPFGAHFGRDCPAPEFERARERLKFERVQAAKQAVRDYAPWIAGVVALLIGGWFWRRRRR
ncbi:MAG: hypothetical protein IPO95_12745 [Rhodanobacteraceae bacterium]|nr:hypothetical protein [Rhodanobacteraceae bacterium]